MSPGRPPFGARGEAPIETPSRNLVRDAAVVQVNVELSEMTIPRTAYPFGKAPAGETDYVLVGASRMFGGNERIGGLAGTHWRLTVRAVGAEKNVGAMLARCSAALEERPLVVGPDGETVESGAIRFETELDVDQDDDDLSLYSGLRSFTFAF